MTRPWLALAASPTFAAMAIFCSIPDRGPAAVLCAETQASPLTGMAAMYLLMAAFHAGPWLKLVSRARPSADRA